MTSELLTEESRKQGEALNERPASSELQRCVVRFFALLEYVGKIATFISVLTACWFYIGGKHEAEEATRRIVAENQRRQVLYDAWILLTLAEGKEASSGRVMALEQLVGIKESLAHINLSGTELVGAKLDGANFASAHFVGSNLSEAHLESADLTHCEFVKAIFGSAHMKSANFRAANLKDSNFSGADLQGAILVDADLRGSAFVGAHPRRRRFARC